MSAKCRGHISDAVIGRGIRGAVAAERDELPTSGTGMMRGGGESVHVAATAYSTIFSTF